jgi:hypothetical protein
VIEAIDPRSATGTKALLDEQTKAMAKAMGVTTEVAAELTRQGRYDRMTDTMCNLTGEAPTNMRNFVKLHAPEFKHRGPAHS